MLISPGNQPNELDLWVENPQQRCSTVSCSRVCTFQGLLIQLGDVGAAFSVCYLDFLHRPPDSQNLRLIVFFFKDSDDLVADIRHPDLLLASAHLVSMGNNTAGVDLSFGSWYFGSINKFDLGRRRTILQLDGYVQISNHPNCDLS